MEKIVRECWIEFVIERRLADASAHHVFEHAKRTRFVSTRRIMRVETFLEATLLTLHEFPARDAVRVTKLNRRGHLFSQSQLLQDEQPHCIVDVRILDAITHEDFVGAIAFVRRQRSRVLLDSFGFSIHLFFPASTYALN
jgi:hypothetical protein